MNLLDLLGIDVDKLVDSLIAQNAESPAEKPYLQPSDAPLKWQTKGKCVSLDRAVMTAHLIAGRIAFKGFPGLLSSLARRVQSKVQTSIEDRAIKDVTSTLDEAAGRAAFIVNLMRSIGTIFQRETLEAQKEAKIRIASIQARTDLYNAALGPRKGARRRAKDVHTRHFTPRKRRYRRRKK